MSVTKPFAALMCHAPIVIPAVAGARASDVADTTASMRHIAARVAAAHPDVVVIVSPHAPRGSNAFTFFAERVEGDFRRFGAPNVQVSFPSATDFVDDVSRTSIASLAAPFDDRDHGALVPLAFLSEAGVDAPTVVVGFPSTTDAAALSSFGRTLKDVAARRREKLAFIASGDMSHRLIPGAPAGHHPRAHQFDDDVVEILRRRPLVELRAIDPALRELAAEDVIESLEVARGVLDVDKCQRVLSYEGPFGVGYLNAILANGADDDETRANDAEQP